jgi:hypothetical protein
MCEVKIGSEVERSVAPLLKVSGDRKREKLVMAVDVGPEKNFRNENFYSDTAVSVMGLIQIC